MEDCIFCKIANKRIPAEIVCEDEQILAFNDVHPIAPVHVLIIPKEHIPTIDDLKDEHQDLVGKMILAARNIARDLNISEDGYKLLFRVKHYGGQEVDHLHLHLIGGAPLAEIIKPI
ncbi:histidine triad nucleotide-binding protein [Candidatus Falkowbacteria bacterium]|nr:histidine triad nucleotide-binding protein [Candidatus Falkowbacteria bacterium]